VSVWLRFIREPKRRARKSGAGPKIILDGDTTRARAIMSKRLDGRPPQRSTSNLSSRFDDK